MQIRRKKIWLLVAAGAVSLVAVLIVISALVTSGASGTKGAGASWSAPGSSSLALSPHSPSSSLQPSPGDSSSPTPPAAATGEGTAAVFAALLAQLPLDNSPDSHSGYNRDLFNAWIDVNHDGCDTRAEVLINESAAAVTTRSTCTVSTGSWYSAYDGLWILDASKLDIDHFVPLKEAWISGAYSWDSTTRTQFGNDLGYAASLLAVSASSNRSKSDRDPASWMPANPGFACDYVATWVAVKYRWNLSVDGTEKRVIESILAGCSSVAVTVPEKATVVLGAGGTNSIQDAPSGGSGSNDGVTDPDYGTCSAANAAGRGPYISGIDPEYGFYRDGDSDGMVCE